MLGPNAFGCAGPGSIGGERQFYSTAKLVEESIKAKRRGGLTRTHSRQCIIILSCLKNYQYHVGAYFGYLLLRLYLVLMWDHDPNRIFIRGPKDHINLRMSHSGSKAQYEGDTRGTVLQDPSVYVVSLGSKAGPPTVAS